MAKNKSMNFTVTFPLTLNFRNKCSLTFDLSKKKTEFAQTFPEGFYYIEGSNGSGKSSFLSMLALLAGSIGKRDEKKFGGIQFSEYLYSHNEFDINEAATIREKYFCIFTQEVFFLPGITTLKNYSIFNETGKTSNIPENEYPNLLSGGQQQNRYIQMIFQPKKSVWFLDEPFNNMDNNNKLVFWELLKKIVSKPSKTFFLIDHSMNNHIKDEYFEHYEDIVTTISNNDQNENSIIAIYKAKHPKSFVEKEIMELKTNLIN